MDDLLRVGIITSPHGIRGEVNVYATSDDPDKFEKLDYVIVQRKNSSEQMDVEDVKYFKNMVILKLSGIKDRNAAENYRNAELMIHRSQSPCEEGQYYVADLLGLKVYNEKDELIGVVSDFMETGANDVFVITKNDKKELLLPDIPECILDIDVEAGKMQVYVLPGLED